VVVAEFLAVLSTTNSPGSTKIRTRPFLLATHIPALHVIILDTGIYIGICGHEDWRSGSSHIICASITCNRIIYSDFLFLMLFFRFLFLCLLFVILDFAFLILDFLESCFFPFRDLFYCLRGCVRRRLGLVSCGEFLGSS
jgi:hypothetical protein